MSTLAQLKVGDLRKAHRTRQDLCGECGVASQTTAHLLKYNALIQPTALWEYPREVSIHLLKFFPDGCIGGGAFLLLPDPRIRRIEKAWSSRRISSGTGFSRLSLATNPKILGVTLDAQMKFHACTGDGNDLLAKNICTERVRSPHKTS